MRAAGADRAGNRERGRKHETIFAAKALHALPRITATVETENVVSARVMEKAGMVWVKTVHDQDFEGNWATRHHYAIERRVSPGGRAHAFD